MQRVLNVLLVIGFSISCAIAQDDRPNILFGIADDWGWPHAGAYGDASAQTPTFDRLAREGVLFENAYVSSPSCTPSRSAILTGQYHWRLKDAANLHSTLRVEFPVYPLLLEQAGYHVGSWRKAWGPGRLGPGGYEQGVRPAGKKYTGFAEFLEARPEGVPFCFWLGASDPHRGYKRGSGEEAGFDLDAINMPEFYPDHPDVRGDIADYLFEVRRFDSDVGSAIAHLERIGELDNTIIVVTGDHGMPFPRCKSNLYDWGVRVPLVVVWGERVAPDRRVTDFVSLTDLAPTFLEAAGVAIPDQMTGRSLLPIATSDAEGRVEASRDHVIFGKERHVPSQPMPSMVGYPSRAIRTDWWLYIRNISPDSWPAGIADAERAPMGWAYSDCDDGPTKALLVSMEGDPDDGLYYDLSFAKRPAEELYFIPTDPDQIHNLAGDAEFAPALEKLRHQLDAALRESNDPRATGGGDEFENYPYYGGSRRRE